MSYPSTDELAAEVRAEMARQRFTPIDVAKGTGISYATVKRRLAGQYPFTMDEFGAVAAFLGVEPSELVDRARGTSVAHEGVA